MVVQWRDNVPKKKSLDFHGSIWWMISFFLFAIHLQRQVEAISFLKSMLRRMTARMTRKDYLETFVSVNFLLIQKSTSNGIMHKWREFAGRFPQQRLMNCTGVGFVGIAIWRSQDTLFCQMVLLPLELKWFFLGLKIWDRLGQKETRFAAYKSYRLIFVHPSPKDIT